MQCVFCWHGKTKQYLFRTLGGETCPSRKHSLSACGGSFPLVQPSLSVENTLRGGSSPAKERGCACAHEGSGLDAVATLTPGRERERETERERESERARESKYGKVHGHPVTSPLHLVSGFSKKGGGRFLVEGLFRFVLSEQAC